MARGCFHYLALLAIVATCSLNGVESQALSSKELVRKGDAILYLAYAPATNMSIISVTLPACTAVSQPHTHPNSAELNTAFKGEALVGYVDYKTGKYISGTVKPGKWFDIPAGALHYVINQACTTYEGSALFAGTSYESVFPMNDLTHLPSSVMGSYYGSSFTSTMLKAGEDLPRFFQEDAACKRRCQAQLKPAQQKEMGSKDSKPKP